MRKDDRRIFERFEMDFPVKVKQPVAETYSEAQCCDVSASGVALLIREKLVFNASLELLLSIPNGHAPFQALARVIWTKQVQENRWRAGFEFARIDLMGLRRILVKPNKS